MIRLPSIQESAQAALCIISAGKSWLDKIVRNPRTGNDVQVRNLPKDLMEKYRPRKEKKQEESPKSAKLESVPIKELERKWKLKILPGSPVDYNDGKTPKSNPDLFPKAADGFRYRLARSIPTNPKFKKGEKDERLTTYGKPVFNPKWKDAPNDEAYCTVPKFYVKPKPPKINEIQATKKYTKKEMIKRAKDYYDKRLRLYNEAQEREKENKTPTQEYVYSGNFFVKHGRSKFAGIQKVMEKWKPLNKLCINHVKKFQKGSQDYAAAVAFAIQLKTAARIGSNKDEPNIFGASSIQRRHLKFKGKIAVLEYKGKDMQDQHNVISDPTLVQALRDFYKKTKNPNDPIITWEKAGKTRQIDSDYINGKKSGGKMIGYLPQLNDKLGLEMTSHHVRHAWAAQVFASEAGKVDFKKIKPDFDDNGRPSKSMIDKVNEQFMICAETVAKKLGNKAKASIDNYIDPTLMIGFWNDFGIKPEHFPKSLKSRIAKANDLLFAHLIHSEVNKKGMFSQGLKVRDFTDFGNFLNEVDFSNEPDVPEEMAKQDLQLWI